MRIVLISPKGPLYRFKGGVFKKSLRYQPLTLTTLASLIPADLGATVELIDEGIEKIPEQLQADMVAMTVITGTAKRAYQLAEKFRKQGITVVLGGPHVTLMPQEAIQHADAICTGYAEQSWPRLLHDFKHQKLQKLYQQGDDFTLVDAPFPQRHLLNKSHYLTQAVFEATRSCAHDCEFCVAPSAWGRKQMQHPVEWVVEDIKRVGQKKIIFIDLNLVSDKRYAYALFEALLPLNVQWYGLSTVLIAHDPALMELMARSGCKGLLLGLESISRSGLKDANKLFNASIDYRQLIQDLHTLGISVQGCFTFGLDSDTSSVFEDTAEFVIDSGVDLPRFSVLTPFPGTPLYQRLTDEGRILTTDWELYDGQHVVFEPAQMSVEQLVKGHENTWKSVYRWSSIAKRLRNARNFKLLTISVNLGYRFYAHRLHQYYNCDWQINPMMPNPFKSDSGLPETIDEPDERGRRQCG